MSSYSTRTERIERYLSLGVGLAVIGALVVSLYQANLARAQLRASAWPYLTQGNDWSTGDYQWTVSNQGVGPAKIRSFQVMVDSQPVQTWNAAVRMLTGSGDSTLTYSSFGRGSVMPAGSTRPLLRLRKGERAQQFWIAAQRRLRTVTCYCSVYDECWSADSELRDPVPIDACTTDPAAEFNQ